MDQDRSTAGDHASSTAARAAESASSMRCFFSFSSTSVAAPTLSTATPPESLARRSWSFSRSKSLVVSSICSLICDLRASMALESPLPSTSGRVLGGGHATRLAKVLDLDAVQLAAEPSLITRAPVRVAMSSSMALRRSPKPEP